MIALSYIFGAFGIASTVVIYQQKQRTGLILSKLVSDAIWFFHYFFIAAYAGAAIAAIGFLRELIFMNKEKKWAKSKAWLVLFIALSVLAGIFTWKGAISVLPCIASVIAVIGFWIGNPWLSRILSFPISALMLTYDIAYTAIMAIINEIFTVISSVVGIIRYDVKKEKSI